MAAPPASAPEHAPPAEWSSCAQHAPAAADEDRRTATPGSMPDGTTSARGHTASTESESSVKRPHHLPSTRKVAAKGPAAANSEPTTRPRKNGNDALGRGTLGAAL